MHIGKVAKVLAKKQGILCEFFIFYCFIYDFFHV